MSNSQIGKEAKIGIFQIALLILSILILIALTFDAVFNLPTEFSRLIQSVDFLVCTMMGIDFFYRLYHAENKINFIKWGWIDLVASIPNLDILRWGRLVSVLRIIRVLRALRSLHRIIQIFLNNKVETGAVSLGLMAFLLIVFSSASILIVERGDNTNIKTAEDAVWWSMSTMTTVGYGDKYPVTHEGRIIGMFLMITGVGMFGGLSGLIASMFLGATKRESDQLTEILQRLERLEEKINSITEEKHSNNP